MIDLADPFDSPADPAAMFDDPDSRGQSIVQNGRYMLPNRDGTPRGRGWMRTTNLASAMSDQRRLQRWKIRKVLEGLRADPSLISRIDPDSPKWNDLADEIAELATDAAGGNEGRDRGTARHDMVEQYRKGETVRERAIRARVQLKSHTERLAAGGLSVVPGAVERIILCESLEVCGKFDALLWDEWAAVHRIGDLKTQKSFWSYLEPAIQFAIYANADAWWNVDKGCWEDVPYAIARDLAIAEWMPEEGVGGLPDVQLHEVDIAWGWENAQDALRIVNRRREAAPCGPRTKRTPRMWVRPTSAPSTVERYAGLIASVESVADGSRLVAEARAAGVWCPELEAVAKASAERLTLTKN